MIIIYPFQVKRGLKLVLELISDNANHPKLLISQPWRQPKAVGQLYHVANEKVFNIIERAGLGC
jgi:hypothetical protein